MHKVKTCPRALEGRHLVALGRELKAIAKRIAPMMPDGEEDLVRMTGEDHGLNCQICGTGM